MLKIFNLCHQLNELMPGSPYQNSSQLISLGKKNSVEPDFHSRISLRISSAKLRKAINTTNVLHLTSEIYLPANYLSKQESNEKFRGSTNSV